MDRNDIRYTASPRPSVALRKESVDRNTQRRDFKVLGLLVALRKESVDRNTLFLLFPLVAGVALRKESVDRNLQFGRLNMLISCRSPQGERG